MRDLVAIGSIIGSAFGVVAQLRVLTVQIRSLERRIEALERYLLES